MIEDLNVNIYIHFQVTQKRSNNEFALESSVLMLLNFILSNRMEHQNQDTLPEDNTKNAAQQKEKRNYAYKQKKEATQLKKTETKVNLIICA